MEILFTIAIIALIIALFFASKLNRLLLIAAILGIIVLWYKIYLLPPEVIVSTSISDTLGMNSGNSYKFDKPVKFKYTKYSYPYLIFRDYTLYEIITKEDLSSQVPQ